MSPRVASLLPSATEIVCAVGAQDDLVGVSHECDHPAEVVGRPVLTSTRVAGSLSSLEIDRGVREVLRGALAVYEVREAELVAARPEVIVTQDLCDVCAVSLSDVERAARELLDPDVRLVSLHPTRLGDIWDDVLRVGDALGRRAEAERAVAERRARIDAVRERSATAGQRPAVLTNAWHDPVMVGGTWMPELVELAGGRPLVTEPGQKAPTVSLDQLGELEPDAVLIKPCGFALERAGSEVETLGRLLAATGGSAVDEGRVWIADGNAFFNRPGPRIADSLEILAACLHPELFPDLAERHAVSYRRWSPA